MLSTRPATWSVTARLSCVSSMTGHWQARITAPASAWSHETAAVKSAITIAAGGPVTGSGSSPIWAALAIDVLRRRHDSPPACRRTG